MLIALLLLGACKGQEQAGNGAAPAAPGADAGKASGASEEEDGGGTQGGSTALTGLYEGGSGARKNQLCMIAKGGTGEFGLIIHGAGGNNCSGAGQAVRSGERLTLTMTGDRTCSLDATLRGGTVTLPARVPEGCAYYCASGAGLAGARFERSGSTRADAMKAKDFADDPLCG